jgi:hypothetical protein
MDLYLIPDHVYLCKTCDGIVFLNLRDDKYIGVGGEELPHLQTLIPGWPVDQVPDTTPAMHERACHVATELHRAGLLTKDKATGKAACPPTLQKGECSIFERSSDTHPHVSPALLIRLIYATLVVFGILKFQSLEWAVNRIRSRKHARSQHVDLATSASVVTLTRKFFRLRPLLYSSRNKCLFDCLVLLEFLSGFGSLPTLVFGVTTFPFKAHCWLQSGPLVLTDYCENTREHSPILVV